MILAAQYARERNLPYFGICLGMQVAVIEYARNVAGIADAHSGEFDELCKHKVIDFMPGQSDDIDKGGTLRLGAYPCADQRAAPPWSGATEHRRFPSATAIGMNSITIIRDCLTEAGLTVSGLSPDGRLVETVELTDRPFLCGRAVSSRIQITTQQSPPPVQGLYSGRIGAQIRQIKRRTTKEENFMQDMEKKHGYANRSDSGFRRAV